MLLMDRLNVRNILRRKKHKLQGNDYSCVLCADHYEETTFHRFFSSHFSRECWRHLGISWRFDFDFHSMMEEASTQFHCKFFMLVFIIGAWLIWKQSNDWVFNRARPSFQGWKVGFIKEAHLQAVRMSGGKKLAFQGLVQLFS
jgi:hypothetical protein